MRKVIYGFTVSIDGFIEGPGNDFEWSVPSPELHQHFNDFERQNIDTHLYGRVMWEQMSAFWPTADEPSEAKEVREYAGIWAAAEHVVFSKTLDDVEGARLVKGDAATEVARLKALPGKGLSIGGAMFGSSMLRAGLVDEVHMYVAPVLLGGGKPMFQDIKHPLRLELLGAERVAEVTLLRYAVSGAR